MKMQKILIVEDEEKIARFLELELQHEGYSVQKAADGRTGLELAQSGGFDLVLLDVMLPQLSGLEVLRRLRKTSQRPVILLPARDAVSDKVSGLDMGSDDYVTKPFSIEELLARIRGALRKSVPQQGVSAADTQLFCGALVMDTASRTVSYAGEAVELTKREFELLELLLRNKNIVLSRESFLEQVWGYDYVGETNVVDVYIRYLRSKLDDRYGVQLIETVRGVGYVMRDKT
ncbi:MAG: response regulator transcription factor [Oscillospiraceae bacterium]|nr:response regulator transcription factor [Oscillospiraceae bacterium]